MSSSLSSSKILYSLPRTQPTPSFSSSKSKPKTNPKVYYPSIHTSPQVSAFSSDDRREIYTHNMKIDYGKLSKPFHEELKKSISKQMDLSEDLGLLLSTRKFKNMKQYTLNGLLNETQREVLRETQREEGVVEPPVHALLTQKKKAFSAQRLACFTSNPQSGTKPEPQPSKQKKRNRIISVKAYQTSNTSFVSLASSTKGRQSGSKFGDTPSMKQKVILQQQETLQSDRSQRKISHSRIIKTFNPTAGMQTKIITYPDLSEVFKIRESRKKGGIF